MVWSGDLITLLKTDQIDFAETWLRIATKIYHGKNV